ncbi:MULTISPECIES: 16S rRNA (cytosine(967)-C(5))-methyltransferase RsmB [Psychrobacillus]|uniref:16S rRNA (cytosine(967)-C(5))-methyltransferase n=1 Tax=Psychrobacillus faecigallinarum TaxID=2762235 RepID=A0ABR8R4Q4_9BACI|nr:MULTISPECIES: 16S rRNA (cytosine(967)-C(5))-methyltransferase RsmB [Psychrobacillus]MBD7942745.1 16S rRNA (cytosine(967)-C(5))-methyltransferase RsmB [Psychrobacillus faecigallinarum]QEY20221.1 16S rRNA (cytosine(967)-C(5))-methyltransferase RsmB [Psychrobacillus sp. AK 1817]QGM30755.1 16S rRNA (cytosine(967)-C(5))-methyltransferase RsmB [Bacillus sp. N3536]
MTKKNEKIWTGNVRDAALTILMAVEKQQAYSNLLLHQTIEKYDIEPKDRALLTELTYGTLQHKMTLDYYLKPFIKGKLDDWVRQLLRLSLYQIHYLSRIPDHAAVNEAVNIAKRRGHKGISGVVNGILRSILREGVSSTESIVDDVERLSIETSHPLWMVKRFISEYGFETTKKMLEENNEPPVTTLRVNLFKRTVEQVMHLMTQEGYVVAQSEVIPECIYLFNGQAAKTTAFQKGFVTIQDESSMIPAYALQPEPGMIVLDMCSAPGGKTTHIAEKMKNTGKLVAMDIHQHKLKLVKENAERLGFSFIETVEKDGRKASELFPEQTFDRILVDAPCSGLGVMKRKPDIKYTKNEKDFDSLKPIQLKLLDEAYKLLKPNGLMVYSTCTVDKEENEGTAKLFLENHPDMQLKSFPDVVKNIKQQEEDGMLQLFPQDLRSDGFFVAVFQKQS